MLLRLRPEQMLPPICPACGADGVVPRAVHSARALESDDTLTAHYCDLCAERLSRRHTLLMGAVAAAGLCSLGVSVFVTLFWGTRLVGLQALLAVTTGVLLAPLVAVLGLPRRSELGIVELGTTDDRGSNERCYSISPVFAKRLRDAYREQMSAAPRSDTLPTPGSAWRRTLGQHPKIRALSFLPVGIALVTLPLVHHFGRARVRVVHAGTRDLVVLIDSRRVAQVKGARFEDPLSGTFVSLLGGRRNLTLVTEDGRVVADQTMTIWPGRSYAMGTLAPGQCLYLEHRSYGSQGKSHLLVPLEGRGPAWEIEERVDGWFRPLPAPPETLGTHDAPLSSSGGRRTAVRLLPCRSDP